MKLEGNAGVAQRTRVNRLAHPRSSSSPERCSGRFPPLPYPPRQAFKYSIPREKTEKPFDHVTVLIHRLRASEYLRLPASSMCPLDLAKPARRNPDYRRGLESRRTIEQILSVSGEYGPSADVT